MHTRRAVTNVAFYDITPRPSRSELSDSGVVIGVAQTCRRESQRAAMCDDVRFGRTRVYLIELRLCTQQTAA
jgi:hypothetical protein